MNNISSNNCICLLVNQVYEKLCSYLTIPDVALLIYTLECVYALSSLGQATCNAFLHCPGTLDILISLLTVEVAIQPTRKLNKSILITLFYRYRHRVMVPRLAY